MFDNQFNVKCSIDTQFGPCGSEKKKYRLGREVTTIDGFWLCPLHDAPRKRLNV